jgi:flagellar assembly protein FliH
VRLIKKQSQAEAAFQKFAFADNLPQPGAHLVPHWMEVADSQAKSDGRPSTADIARLEQAAMERGRLQAESSAMQLADQKMQAMMRRYADAILEIGKLRRTLYSQAEHQVVKLALEVARKIVHREVQVDREIVQTLIRIALSHVIVKSAVTIHVNPADYSYVVEQHSGSMRSGAGEREMVLVADRSVERGGCLIETECGDVDARIEEEFLEVEHAFFSSGE